MPLNTKHNYSAEEMVKIAGPKATFITESQAREILDSEARYAVRIFGLFEDGKQIVKIASNHYLDKYNVSALWISGTTIADLIGRK